MRYELAMDSDLLNYYISHFAYVWITWLSPIGMLLILWMDIVRLMSRNSMHIRLMFNCNGMF